MASRGSRIIFLPFVLLIVLAHAAEEAKSSGQNIGDKNDVTGTTPATKEGPPRTSPVIPSDSSSDEGWPEHVAEYQTDHRPSREEEGDDAGSNDDDEDEYVYEGEANGGGEEDEDDDEYVDELKAIAESHEAMSKGNMRNNASSMDGLISLPVPVERTQHASQRFESDETTLVESSDEDVASNEAIIDEVFGKSQDEEVAELLKYKKEKNSNTLADERTKSKRVPTVKKELSTQKEILIAGNETQVPKSLEPSEETFNRLNEEIADPPQRRDLQTKETEAAEKARQESAQQERPAIDGKINADNRFTGVESTSEASRRLDKRQQETFLKNLRSYLLAEYAAEREQRQKLEELGVREGALAEGLLKLLVNLAENPTSWERVHQLLPEIANELDASKITREPEKRGFDTSLHSPITTSASADGTEKGKKKPKKKKKKKKKPKRTTTTTPVTPPSFPATTAPSVPVTTETTWLTTQWRQVAERLLGFKHENPKIHYALQPQSRNGTGAKSFGIEQIHAPADRVKEPVESRPIHFGKVNTHLPTNEADSRPRPAAFDSPKDSSPTRPQGHDIDKINQRPRYESMPEVSQGFSHPDVQEDYQDDFPPGMDYGQPEFNGKNRFGISYDYDRPWPTEDHGFPSSAPSNRWNWRRPVKGNRKFWPQGQPWRTEDNFWTRDDEADGNFNVPMDTSWQRREQMRNAWNSNRSKLPPWIHDDMMKARERPNVSWAKSKNLSENQEKDQAKEKSKDNSKLPKITMKAWNSLTSDPATWPYQLPGAKPWPKDANGKSYNPNADLVKKLGLDDERAWTKENNEKPYRFQSDSSGKLNVNTQGMSRNVKPDIRKPWMIPNESKDWQNVRSEEDLSRSEDPSVWRGKYEDWAGKSIQREDPPKIQSVGAWVMPGVRTNWRPYEMKPMEEDDELSARRQWSRLNIPDRPWSANRNRDSWPGRENDSWKAKYSDPWQSDTTWPATNGMGGSWVSSGKSSSQPWIGKSNPWIPKSNPWLSGANSWSSKSEEDVRRSKSPWLSTPNLDHWASKSTDDLHRPSQSNDQAIWGGPSNEDILRSKPKIWLTPSDPWRSKPEDIHPNIKSSDPHSWTSKLNDEQPWSNSDTWGSRSENVDWPAKAKDPNIWTKSNERPWSPQKPIEPNSYLGRRRMNEEWNSQYGKDSSNNWPASRWFAYHRVTALPIAKPGTNADATKAKNAFVAVSALSSPKYGQGSEWRKNEIEEVPFVVRNDHALRARSEEAERLTSGSLARVDLKKRTVLAAADKENKTDALESQLEALGRSDGAAGNTTDSVERASMQPVDHLTPITPTNSTALDKGHEDAASAKAEKEGEERKKVEQEASTKKDEEVMP